MTTGIFSCLVKLVPELVDTVYDVKLGRDWFNYCTHWHQHQEKVQKT